MEEALKEIIEELKDYCFPRFGKELTKEKSEAAYDTLVKMRKYFTKFDFILEASKLKKINHPKNKALKEGWSAKVGDLVKIAPCGDEYNDKTYLGICIGSVALGSTVKIEDDAIVCEFSGHNPAFLVPDLKEVIYGAGSYWGKVESEEDLKDITKDDINNLWYVKALKGTDERA